MCIGLCTSRCVFTVRKMIRITDEGVKTYLIISATTTNVLALPPFLTIFSRYTDARLRHDLPFHDLITQTIGRDLQYGIVVLGMLDAFVYAHNHHRHNREENPGHLQDCMEGRIRLMTALTPVYAHAFQNLGLARRPDCILARNFRPLAPKAKNRNLPQNRTMALASLLKDIWPVLEQVSTPITQPSSRASSSPCGSSTQ